MNQLVRLSVCTLVACVCSFGALAQPAKSESTAVAPARNQSDERDKPFCPPKESVGTFCLAKNSKERAAGCTRLIRAAEAGQLARVRALLASGAKPDDQIGENITALAIAAGAGQLEVVKVLLAAGANPNLMGATFHGGPFAVWMFALNRCNKNWLAIFEAMLNAGVELNPRLGIYMSPIGVAIHKDDTVMLKELIKKGANVNLTDPDTGETPLMFAARYSTSDIVNVLLDAGAEINAKDKQGKTALSAASENFDAQTIIGILQRRGANP